MKRVALLVVVLAAAGQAAAFAPFSRAGRSPICTRGLVTVQRDPRRLLPLTPDAVAAAATAAVRDTGRADGAEVISSDLATADRNRGGEARFECGARVWRRTVVVYITLRGLEPNQSRAEKVFFVGRFANGYRVWQVVH